MNLIKSILLLLIYVQTSIFALDSKPSSNEIEITTNSAASSEISATGWKIENDMLLYNLDGDFYQDKISLDEIGLLEEKVGTHSIAGFIWGFAPTFLFSMYINSYSDLSGGELF